MNEDNKYINIKDIAEAKGFPKEEIQLLEIEPEEVIDVPQIEEKPKKERKKTPREQQMNRPFFNSNYEKFEWLVLL